VKFHLFRGLIRVTAFLVVLCALNLASAARATIRYEVSLAHPEQHLFRVRMTIPDVAGELTLQMPAWNALYQLRDFSSHLQQVEAFAGTSKMAIEKLDKQTWRIEGHGTLTVRYTTYWDESGPFATQLNTEHAFINPALILMYLQQRRAEDVHLDLCDVPGEWRAASPSIQPLETRGDARNFSIDASSYDALADAPIEVGKFEEFQLDGIKPEIWVVIHGDKWKRSKVENDLTRICRYELNLMGGAPYQHYIFIIHTGDGSAGAGGGMEHTDSTAIAVPSDEYLPGIAAHEFFHLWNVKRIRPSSLEPVDYTKEQYTRALWFAEGVTSTYESYTLLRSGIWNKQQLYQDLGEQITELERRPANRWQSAEQSSLDAWLEKYPMYNRPEQSISYYTKGQVLGVLLDILMRDGTNNEQSLDDLLRAMNTEFAKQGKTYRDSLDVRITAEKIAGGSFDEFFRKYVTSAEPLPYQNILSLAGLTFRTVEQKGPALGFFAERDPNETLVVQSVDGGGSAAQAGLRPGDVIVKWNGGDVPGRLDRWLRERAAGDHLRLRVRRGGKEAGLEFSLGGVQELRYQVVEDSQASEKALRIRDGILHGATNHVAMHRN